MIQCVTRDCELAASTGEERSPEVTPHEEVEEDAPKHKVAKRSVGGVSGESAFVLAGERRGRLAGSPFWRQDRERWLVIRVGLDPECAAQDELADGRGESA